MENKKPIDGYLGVEFKRVNYGVEKALVKNPIKVPGIGLTKEFHDLFDKLSPEKAKKIKLERAYSNKKNQ